MTGFERWSIGVTSAVVTVSGTLYLWVKYFLTPMDPFSVINHPLQPVLLQLHLLSGPPLVLLFGMILQSHILKKNRSGHRPNRRTGLVALWMFGVMTMSGYGLQVLTVPASITAVVWLHIGSGIAFVLSYMAHLAISLRLSAASNAGVVKPNRLVSSAR